MSDRKRREEIALAWESILAQMKDGEGRVEVGACSDAEDALTDWLDSNPEPRNTRQEARKFIRNYMEGCAQKYDPEQGVLFNTDDWYALGETQYVRAAEARAAHLQAHLDILTENFNRQRIVYTAKRKWFRERMAKFRSRSETLLEVERREFGYQG